MLNNCSSLESIDLSSFTTSDLTYVSGMFNNCSSLLGIYIKCNDPKILNEYLKKH